MKNVLLKTILSLAVAGVLVSTNPVIYSYAVDSTAISLSAAEDSFTLSSGNYAVIKRVFTSSYKVTINHAPVHSGPGAKYSVIRYLAKGTSINVESISKNWAKYTSGGVSGYIYTAYITKK